MGCNSSTPQEGNTVSTNAKEAVKSVAKRISLKKSNKEESIEKLKEILQNATAADAVKGQMQKEPDQTDRTSKPRPAHSISMSNIQVERSLVYAVEDEDIESVVKRLAKYRISCVPVFKDKTSRECVGVLDFSSLASFVVSKVFDDPEPFDPHGSLQKSKSAAKLTLPRERGISEDAVVLHDHSSSRVDRAFWSGEVSATTVREVLQVSQSQITPTISLETSLLEAAKLFGGENKPRRLLVVDNDKKVVAVLSCFRIFLYAIEKEPQLFKSIDKENKEGTIKTHNMGNTAIQTVSKGSPLSEALRIMNHNKTSIVGVVDPTNVLVGSISVSDIKSIFQSQRLGQLESSCWALICRERERSLEENFPFFGLKESATVSQVVLKLLATHVHHLYVLDENVNPKRVISFSDICELLDK